MTTPAAPARRAPAARAGPAQPEDNGPGWLSTLQRMAFIFIVTQLVTTYFLPKPTPPSPAAKIPDGASTPGTPDPFKLPPKAASSAWPLGTNLSMHVYLSTSPIGDVFGVVKRKNWGQAHSEDGARLPRFSWEGITYGDWTEQREIELQVDIPPSVQRNASLWADIFLTKDNASPDPTHPNYEEKSVYHVRKLLTRYLPKPKIRKEKNLLGGSINDDTDNIIDEAEEQPNLIVPYWHNNLTLTLISDAPSIPVSSLPAPLAPYITLIRQRDSTGTHGYYLPVIYPNDFWHLRNQLVEINSTTTQLPLKIEFHALSYWKFQMYASLNVGFEEAGKSGQGAAELDEIKRMLVETNPWFLALTALVSTLHVLFEMLAFKSDVSHWRNKEQLVGVSVRTIIVNVFVQTIILLYLVDNNTDTSWMILMGQGVGIVIEAWKVTKAVDIKLLPSPAGALLPYRLDIQDKHVLSEDEKNTQEYDKLAFRYVSYVAIPTLAAYTVYSLIYETHRGWYSFVISTLTSFVYMFGFVQLVPQLIINYKLKSVAHMPMKAMIYKTLSTVVDDFFAFCIKMPWLHRLACFRDDVVFLVFLYQRWIYRVDKKRVNEYGQIAVDAETEVTQDGKVESKKDK